MISRGIIVGILDLGLGLGGCEWGDGRDRELEKIWCWKRESDTRRLLGGWGAWHGVASWCSVFHGS
jgi:hypothetical protein